MPTFGPTKHISAPGSVFKDLTEAELARLVKLGVLKAQWEINRRREEAAQNANVAAKRERLRQRQMDAAKGVELQAAQREMAKAQIETQRAYSGLGQIMGGLGSSQPWLQAQLSSQRQNIPNPALQNMVAGATQHSVLYGRPHRPQQLCRIEIPKPEETDDRTIWQQIVEWLRSWFEEDEEPAPQHDDLPEIEWTDQGAELFTGPDFWNDPDRWSEPDGVMTQLRRERLAAGGKSFVSRALTKLDRVSA